MEAVKKTVDGILVDIDVSPKSSHFSISGYNVWRKEIEVKIKAVPQKGKANQELIKEFHNLTNRNVEIISGQKSRHKTLKVYTISKKQFEDIIRDYLKNK